MQPGRPTALVIHDDGDALDLLTRVFEAGGFGVVPAVTGFRALAHLEGDRENSDPSRAIPDPTGGWSGSARGIAVVVVPWDAARAVGGEVYRWSLQHRYDLRDRFVFLAVEVPAEFDRTVAGRCLAVSLEDPAEVVRVAWAAVRRRAQLEAARDEAVAELDADQPTLLLAEDDPWLAERVVFLAGEAGADIGAVAPGRPVFRKGADSRALAQALREIVRQARGGPPR